MVRIGFRSDRPEGVFTKKGRRAKKTIQVRSDRPEGAFSGKDPRFRAKGTIPVRPDVFKGVPRQEFKPRGGTTGPPRPGESIGGQAPIDEDGLFQRILQRIGDTLQGTGGQTEDASPFRGEQGARIIGGTLLQATGVGRGATTVVKTSERLTFGNFKLSSLLKGTSKAETPATRAAANLNKLYRAGKISSTRAARVTKEIDKLSVKEIIERLQNPSGIRKFLFKTTATATLSAGIAEWYAADNLATGSKIASNIVINQVRFGQLSKEDALTVINRAEFNAQIARAAVVGAMAIAPLSAPVGLLFLKGITADIQQIEVNRQIVEAM